MDLEQALEEVMADELSDSDEDEVFGELGEAVDEILEQEEPVEARRPGAGQQVLHPRRSPGEGYYKDESRGDHRAGEESVDPVSPGRPLLSERPGESQRDEGHGEEHQSAQEIPGEADLREC